MSMGAVVVEGRVQADGSLELDQKLNLPEGRVHVTIEPVAEATETVDPDRFWAMMSGIWAVQDARGHVPRSSEEIDAEIRQFRDESEEEAIAIERLQEHYRRGREDGQSAEERPR